MIRKPPKSTLFPYPTPFRSNATADDGDASNNIGDDPHTVTIKNVAPSVVLSGDFSDVDEGTTRTYTYTVTDPGADSPSVTESCGGGAAYISDATANSFKCKFLDGPGSSTVNATADDGDASNNIGDDPHTVTIKNVAPSVVRSGDFSDVDEGTTRTYTYTVTDPGADSPSVTESCGGGAAYISDATANTFKCKFLDGPGSSTVNATADDGDASNNSSDERHAGKIRRFPPTVVLYNDFSDV